MLKHEKFYSLDDETKRSQVSDGLDDWHEEKNDGEKLVENIRTGDLPSELIDVEKFKELYGFDFAADVYDWYNKAIKRRDREALDEYRFTYHFFEDGSYDKPCFYGDLTHGFLLGFYKDGIFVPTHFAPKSIRKGYDLFKKLGEGQLPAVLFITPDLADTLKKMPSWKIEDFEIPGYFRGEEGSKRIAHNKFPGYQEKLMKMAQEYMSFGV